MDNGHWYCSCLSTHISTPAETCQRHSKAKQAVGRKHEPTPVPVTCRSRGCGRTQGVRLRSGHGRSRGDCPGGRHCRHRTGTEQGPSPARTSSSACVRERFVCSGSSDKPLCSRCSSLHSNNLRSDQALPPCNRGNRKTNGDGVTNHVQPRSQLTQQQCEK